MLPWDPNQYLKFARERVQPALDLIARISDTDPGIIYDLGSGTGNITHILQKKWPVARIVGLDASQEMLERARADYPEIDWFQADLKIWEPEEKIDIIFSNAVFHWIDNHKLFFRKLMDWIAPGGQLAIQMPNNFDQASHTTIAELVNSPRWQERLTSQLRKQPVLAPSEYYEFLSPLSSNLEIWETTYYQILEGENPVTEWTRGSILLPIIEVLDEEERELFLQQYTLRVNQFYQKNSDGKTLFPYTRLFIIAQKE